MKVITLSKTFPAYHPRAGEQTGFAESFLSGRKIHTIRANVHGYYQDGDIVSVRQWGGLPYRSKQETLQDGVRIGVVPIQLSWRNGSVNVRFVSIPYSPSVIARNDGLSYWDFVAWFNPRRLPDLVLNCSIIHFTDFRYA